MGRPGARAAPRVFRVRRRRRSARDLTRAGASAADVPQSEATGAADEPDRALDWLSLETRLPCGSPWRSFSTPTACEATRKSRKGDRSLAATRHLCGPHKQSARAGRQPGASFGGKASAGRGSGPLPLLERQARVAWKVPAAPAVLLGPSAKARACKGIPLARSAKPRTGFRLSDYSVQPCFRPALKAGNTDPAIQSQKPPLDRVS